MDVARHPEVEVVIEATGSPEAGIRHVRAAIAADKHVVMVTVEADALAGPCWQRRPTRRASSTQWPFRNQRLLGRRAEADGEFHVRAGRDLDCLGQLQSAWKNARRSARGSGPWTLGGRQWRGTARGGDHWRVGLVLLRAWMIAGDVAAGRLVSCLPGTVAWPSGFEREIVAFHRQPSAAEDRCRSRSLRGATVRGRPLARKTAMIFPPEWKYLR